MKRDKHVVSLTIFLLKDGMKEGDAISAESLKGMRSFPVELDGKQVGSLHVNQNPEHPPNWASFFAGSVNLRSRDLKNASVSAILLTRASGRLFALSFGHGRHLLNPGCYEERFGLRVTLNSVDAEQLRAVDITTLEANPFHGKRQAARAAPLGEFGLNLDQDLLRAVTGKPINDNLGTQMTGMDSLTVRVRTDLSGLKPLLTKYLAKSAEDNYKKRFAWVDHVAEVRDRNLCDQLFNLVAVEIARKSPKNVWAAIPEVVDWTTFDYFRFGAPSGKHTYDDINLDKIIDACDGMVPTVERLKKLRVFCMSKGSTHPITDWTFLRCVTAEIPLDGDLYLLNAETWYRISRDYQKQVDADVLNIPSGSLPLTEWGDENEAEYNTRMARKGKGAVALMDKVMVTHPGMPSPIEFCDLYSKDHHMIHVKRYGQSSVLSHLFAQGLVSATSTLSDAEFRKAANKKLPPSHQFADPDERIASSGYEVCYAIGSSDHGRLVLPFFSRVTLRNAYRTLTQTHGFKVSLTKIPVSKLTDLN